VFLLCGILIPSRCSYSGKPVGLADPLSSLLRLSYNILYNMLSECCIEYINLYNFTEDFRVVFRFLAYIYLWANSSVAMA